MNGTAAGAAEDYLLQEDSWPAIWSGRPRVASQFSSSLRTIKKSYIILGLGHTGW